VGKKSNKVQAALKFKFDYWLALSIVALLVIGMLMVYSTTFDYGVRFVDGDATYYFRRQLTAMLIGLGGLVIIMQFDYHLFRKTSVPIMLVTLVLLFITLFFAEEIFGARRGLSGGSYQPSEIAKLATILYIADWLSSKGDRIRNIMYGLIPFSIIIGIVGALIVRQPDLSTAVLIAGVAFTVFFVAGADLKQFAAMGLLGSGAFVLLTISLDHARIRVTDWATALRDPTQAGWHVRQSLIALANGGWLGVGPGNSAQKFGQLPAAHTDSVFAVLGEELGLMGSLLVIFLLGMLIWRGVRTAMYARDSYGALLALGITCWLGYQALINIAVITAVVPFTGLPLPFLSYGGSSLAVSLFAVGILLNISRDQALDRRQRTRPQRSQGSRSNGPPTVRKMEAVSEAARVRRRYRRSYLPGDSRSK
jgi:cell division protein FtsW